MLGFLTCCALLCFASLDARPAVFSSENPDRKYSLEDLQWLISQLQEEGAVPTAEPNVAFSADADRDKQQDRKLSGLEKTFRKAFSDPQSVVKGDVIYSLRRWSRLRFEFNASKYLSVTEAKLYLYKMPLKAKLKRRGLGLLSTRVHIFNAPKKGQFLSGITVVDSRSIRLSQTGWITFDVTAAVEHWMSNSKKQVLDHLTTPHSENNFTDTNPHYLEIWVESTEVGKLASKTTRNTKFVTSKSRRDQDKRPHIELSHTHPPSV